jgi:hypothetical protein
MAFGHLYGLGHDIDERYPGQIMALTPEKVGQAAREYLDPQGSMVIACVGPGAKKLDLIPKS